MGTGLRLDRLAIPVFRLINEGYSFQVRFRGLSRVLTPYLKGCAKVLDVGSSNGALAKKLQDLVGGEFIGVDVLAQSGNAIPIVEYDGRTMPFGDDHFDCVMLIDVLHHEMDQERLLSEARRVSRRYILIKDHYFDTRLDLLLLKIVDYVGNKPYGIRLPYRYLSLESWHRLLAASSVGIIDEKWFRYSAVDPCKHVLFMLEKE